MVKFAMPQPAAMKRITKLLGLAVAGLLVLAVVVPVLFEDEIGEAALRAAREQLRTELEVGDVDLSLLRDFPYASVALEDVRLAGYRTDDLLRAERVTGRIGYYDLLFADDWTIHTLRVEQGRLDVHRPADKQGNWLVLNPAPDSAAGGKVAFSLDRIILEEVSLRYGDVANATTLALDAVNGELAGAFGAEQYTLNGQLGAYSLGLQLGELSYIEDFTLAADLSLDIDLADNTYTFGESTVTLDGMPVDVSGTIGFVKASTSYNLRLATEEGQLGALLKALPHDWVTSGIRALQTRGDFALDGTIAGLYDARHNPRIDFSGELRDGRLLVPGLDREAEDVRFTLDYTNGDGRSMADSKLQLSGIRAYLDGQRLSGDFAWRNFDDPYYVVEASGRLPLSWFDELLESGTLSGTLTLDGLAVEGRQRHIIDTRHIDKVRAGGRFGLEDVELDYLGERFVVTAPALSLDRNVLDIREASIAGLDNELALDLTLVDVLPALLSETGADLRAEGTLTSRRVDLDRWVDLFTREAQLTSKGDFDAATRDDMPVVTGFAGRLLLNVENVYYGDVRARDFEGKCVLEGANLNLTGEAYAMEGHWEVDGEVALLQAPRLSAKLGCTEVNVTELFEQTGNVGQEVVEAKHLEGQMTTRAYVEARWTSAGELAEDGLHVWANVGLTDGELRDFEMLQALSRFVRSDDLAHIQFTDVENWIEVTDDRVYLPAMFIQSSATNFTMAGEHSFAHDIDYAVRVNGAQVLLTKLFGKREGITFIPDRRHGWARTGFKIEGTLVGDDYDVRMAGGAVREHLGRSLRRKAAIRTKLGELFGYESLIDDYDDDGERRLDRPATRSNDQRVIAAGAARRSRDRTTSPAKPREAVAAVTVNTDEYIDWDDEEEVADSRETAPAALSGAAKPLRRTPTSPSGAERQDAKPTRPLDGLFKATPSEYEDPDSEEDEYLEGFDTPGGG